MPPLVTTNWLAANLAAPDLAILDCTHVDPSLGRDPRAEYAAAHVPGARFLDIPAVSDPDTDLPTMLPPPALFAGRMRELGMGDGDRIVLYDDSPWHTAARAWFTFRSFGIPNVAILDGGLAKWRAEDRPLTTDVSPVRSRPFAPRDRNIGVRDMAAVAARTEQLVDARSPARFSGAEADPRPGVAPGHIPGSTNLPYTRLFAADGTYKPLADLKQVFAEADVDLDCPVIATCGSGITASTIAFAAHLLGHEIAVYDGSWSEWGADPSTPKATA